MPCKQLVAVKRAQEGGRQRRSVAQPSSPSNNKQPSFFFAFCFYLSQQFLNTSAKKMGDSPGSLRSCEEIACNAPPVPVRLSLYDPQIPRGWLDQLCGSNVDPPRGERTVVSARPGRTTLNAGPDWRWGYMAWRRWSWGATVVGGFLFFGAAGQMVTDRRLGEGGVHALPWLFEVRTPACSV